MAASSWRRTIVGGSGVTLEPISLDVARAILDGDRSAVAAGAGWPHDDTLDGLAMSVVAGAESGWFVVVDGRVVGDCGTVGPVGADGRQEIGYGLAEPSRGRGIGTEVVRALSGWILDVGDATIVTAGVDAQNVASRRVLEKSGFGVVADDGAIVGYELRRRRGR